MTQINARSEMTFRLAPDQMRRLERACKRRGQTKQTFVENAVLTEVAADEDQREAFRKEKVPAPEETPQKTRSNDLPFGGLADKLQGRRKKERERERETFEAPPSPVVVNVNSNGAPQDHGIDALANYVLAGKGFEQTHRLHNAAGILQANASTSEERRALATRLDEAIAAKEKSANKKKEGEGVLSGARIAFDKLADLLR